MMLFCNWAFTWSKEERSKSKKLFDSEIFNDAVTFEKTRSFLHFGINAMGKYDKNTLQHTNRLILSLLWKTI